MSGTRDVIAHIIRLLADLPIIGPTPLQQFVAVPTATGGGHGPAQSAVALTTTTTAAAVSVTIPVNLSIPMIPTWPRSVGVGTTDSTGLAAVPVVTNATNTFTLGTALAPVTYLKGRVVYNLQIATTVANPTAGAGFTVAPITLAATAISAPDGLIVQSVTTIANIANSGHFFNTNFIHEFVFPYLSTRTSITFTLVVTYVDGGTAQITISSGGGGDVPFLVIDE